MLDCEPLGGSP